MIPKIKLTIDKTKEGYRTSIEEISGHTFPVRLEKKITTDAKDKKRLIASLSLIGQIYGIVRGYDTSAATQPEDIVWSRLESSGKELYDCILPEEIRDTLERYDCADVIIDSNDIEIPFELFHDGDGFLCMKHNIGRQVRTQKKLNIKVKDRSNQHEIRAAVVCDPTGDLKGAYEEGVLISKILKEMPAIKNVDFLSGGVVTKENFKTILSGDYDIIHYAGHIDYDEKDPDMSSFRLADGALSAAEVKKVLKGNPLVFANACTSARSSAGMRGMAASFIYGGEGMGGVVGYIGSAWPVHDDAALEFSNEFYQNIGRGKTIGESLTEGRKKIVEKFSKKESAWASFILYGDPARRIVTKKIIRYIKRKTYISNALAVSKVSAGAGASSILLGLLAVLAGADFNMGAFAINLGGTGIAVLMVSLPVFLLIKVFEMCGFHT